ncbi:MAG: hypothetical protein IJQ31_15000 [Thermoguttaceae bacterium]|nr:hypothetical protein [Thermoguttaceae bacterium]
MEEIKPRTKYLIENPALIRAVGVRCGVPFRELDDFGQEVLMSSLIHRDNYDPTKCSIKTYATRYVSWRARCYVEHLGQSREIVSDMAVHLTLMKQGREEWDKSVKVGNLQKSRKSPKKSRKKS